MFPLEQNIETRKMKRAKRYIRSNYKAFGGCLTATECMRAAQITKSTFYRYLQEMREEDKANGIFWSDEDLAEYIVDNESATQEEIVELIKKHKKTAHQSSDRSIR